VSFDPKLAANGPYDVAQPAASTKIISYVPDVEIGANYEITFKAVNGVFKGSTDWKLVSTGHKTDGTAASANADDDVIATVTDYVADANGNYTEMVLTVDAGLQIDADEVVSLVMDGDSDGAYTIAVSQGATKDVTVAVPLVKSDTGVEKNAPKASAKVVLTKGDTMTAIYTDKKNVIDVNTQRLKLLVDGVGPDKFAKGNLKVDVGGADKHYDLTTNAADTTYTVTMEGDMSGITAITLGGQAFTIDAATNTATLTTDNGTVDITSDPLLQVTVDETTVLNTRSFKISVVIDDVSHVDNNPNVTNKDRQDLGETADKMVWDINGYQAKIRNVANKPGTKTTAITLFNENALDAELTADITMDDGTVVPTVTLPNVKSGTRSVVTAAAMDEATGGALGTGSYTVQFTMTIPNADGDAVAFQETSRGSRVLPVVDNNRPTISVDGIVGKSNDAN
jgi:hypothetical protein